MARGQCVLFDFLLFIIIKFILLTIFTFTLEQANHKAKFSLNSKRNDLKNAISSN